MTKPNLRIIPLGGVGEVGKNMLVLECGDDIVVIDAGLKFPDESMPGIDLVIPDTTYLQVNRHRIRGIVITHGHEDHVGALPYILRELDVPVYCTTLTRGLISVKLKEHHKLSEATLAPMTMGAAIQLGCFQITPLPVNHSIPDGVALAIDTPHGRIVHTGDFKFDQSPVSGRPTDLRAIAEMGRQGVLALLSDCVRVERPGFTPSERVVGEAFDAIMAQAPGRVIITTFASNISRVQQAIDVANSQGRKVAIAGRSMSSNLSVAAKLGFARLTDDTVGRIEQVRKLPDRQIVFVTTGSQGEPTSVLSRIANSEHPQIRITPGDTVIIAATPVPGNEDSVARTIDNLLRLGAEVVYDAVMTVHVSGHASREELRQVIELLRPRFCVPLHGDYRHMVLYRKLALECGLTSDRVLLPELGDIIEMTEQGAWLGETVPAGSVLVEGMTAGAIGEGVLRERQELARNGVVIAAVTVDGDTGQLVGGPEITSRGFLEDGDIVELVANAKEELRRALRNSGKANLEPGYLSRRVRETMSEFLYQETRRKPLVLPLVSEI